jgi:outer membrane receptor protein involved in Fe transport
MKKLFLFLVLAMAVQGVLGQQAPGSTPGGANRADSDDNGKITGVVVDAGNDAPVEFATVSLVDPATNKPIDGTVCDDKGKFVLNRVKDGSYKVVISFIGYETKSIDVTISARNNSVDLGTIKIASEAKVLNEVTVQGQRALVEERVDRTVYNAENDNTTKGGDATDVLRRVPLLSVDMDGNVSMRGNQNIRVLINNKPSTIAANSVADALKQIPADQIKSVEVITSPSAKYDAEGSAGIINIITKKNTLEGLTLNVDAGVGLRGSNLGLNGNYRRKNMGFSLGGFGRANYNVTGAFENDQLNKTTGTRTLQEADTRNNNLFGRYQLGWDWDINKNNVITASARYGVRNGQTYQDDLRTRIWDENGLPLDTTLRDVNTIDNSGTFDFNIDYTHYYEKPQRELSFSAQYSRNDRQNDFKNTNYNVNDRSTINRTKNINDSYNEEITFQVDYQTPIAQNQMLEMGGKSIVRRVSSDYTFFEAQGSDGPYAPSLNNGSNNVFDYTQNIAAGYLSYSLTALKTYNIKAGVRYEYTTISADFKNPEEDIDTDIPSYGVIVPSVNVSRKLKNGNTIKAAYNRRIQRPSIQFLNPNRQSSNPLFITVGNPSLDPEYTNNFELSYSTFVKGTTLNFSGFVRNTTDAIQSIRTPFQDTIVLTSYRNIGTENAYGLSTFANGTIGKLMLSGGVDVYYASLDNNARLNSTDSLNIQASNSGWVVSGRIFGSYNLSKGWAFQFFGFMRGRQVLLQGTQGGFGMYSFGVRKEFNNKKGSIGFGAENFLTSAFRIRTETNSPTISQKSVNELHNMNFRINFSYRIGKMSFDNQPRRRKSINNDDLKDGGDGNGGMGMGDQSTGQRGGGVMPSGGTGNRGGQTQQPAPQVPAANDSVQYEAAGTWTYTIESPQGAMNGTITLTKEGDEYKGSIKSARQDGTFTKVTVVGNNVTMNYTANFGGNEIPVEIKTVIDKDDMTGVMAFGQFRTIEIKAKRQPK